MTDFILRLLEEHPAYAVIPLHKIIEEIWDESARDVPRRSRIRNRVVGIEYVWSSRDRIAKPAGLGLTLGYGGKSFVSIYDWSRAEVVDVRGVYIRYRSPDEEYPVEHPREDIEECVLLFAERYMARHYPTRPTASPAPPISNVASNTIAQNITINVPGAEPATSPGEAAPLPLRPATDSDRDACINEMAAKTGGKTDRDTVRKEGPEWLKKQGIYSTADAMESRFKAEVHREKHRTYGDRKDR